jgi:predicted phage terminase large subunit-like protein
MKTERQMADVVYRNSFGAFCHAAFEVLNPAQRLVPNWHIVAVCYAIEQMVAGESEKRLVLNQPPRTLKSYIVSVCLPAWVLGRDPGARIICASYSEDLAHKFSRDCRALMESPLYKRVFSTRLNPKKSTESEFETTGRGYRLATSVGGTLTGRGGDILIIDDPIKANDANSQVALTGADEWFHNTALSRLDSADSLVLVTMQRLHEKDLSGILIERGWRSLVLPAIATETRTYVIGKDEAYTRPVGQLLQPERDSQAALEVKKHEIGSRLWAAQYQQNPTPAEGNVIKAAWLARYDFPPAERRFRRVVLACDPAGKPGAHNDYTAIIICGFGTKPMHLLHVARGHWSVLQMHDRITTLAREWHVDFVIIEDTSSGMGLIQLLREDPSLNVKGLQPKANKEVRMSRHEGIFEAGNILLPKEAPWLADFEAELLAFPNGRYDDQVDALLLFLDWLPRAQRFDPPTGVGLPIKCYDDGMDDGSGWRPIRPPSSGVAYISTARGLDESES